MGRVIPSRTLAEVSLNSVNVTNNQGERYIIAAPGGHVRVQECLQVYLSHPLYHGDRGHIKRAIEDSLHRVAGNVS